MNYLKSLTIFFIFVTFFVSSIATPVLAGHEDGSCKSKDHCDAINTFQILGCVNQCGCTYKVRKCESDSCLREYTEQNCAKAPPACNKPCTGNTNTGGQSNVQSVFGEIQQPTALDSLGSGENAISTIIQRIIQLFYLVAGVGFVIMFLWAGVSLILSGGDKEGVAKAKGRLTWAIIGLVVMSFAFVIFRLLEGMLGFKFLG